MNVQLRSMDFHSHMSDCELRLTKNLAKQMASRPKQLTRDLQIQQQLWKCKLHPRQWNLTELFVLSTQTDFLLRLLMCNDGLLLSFSTSLGLYLPSFSPSLFWNISFSLFRRMIRPWPPLLNWPLVEPVTHLELQRSLKSWEHLCLVLANNPIKDMIWTCPLYFRTYSKYF